MLSLFILHIYICLKPLLDEMTSADTSIMVMGAGAIGSLFGGILSNAGYDVTLVGRKPHVDAINKGGLRISGLIDVKVGVEALCEPTGGADVVLLTVKSYDTEQAVRMIPIEDDTVVLSLQNGLGNEEIMSDILGGEHVLGGVTSYGSLFVEPGHVKCTGIGEVVLGELYGRVSKRAESIREMFLGAGIKSQVSDNIRMDIWKKLVVNVAINPLTAILDVRNGALIEHAESKELMREAIREAVMVAERERFPLLEEASFNMAVDVASKTAENRSSMLQDVKHGRRTEIDAINGAVVRLGEKDGIETPVNNMFCSLVKAMEKR